MKRMILAALLVAFPVGGAMAQQASQSLASTMDVYVFPKDGQEADQQSKDESSCYDWATSNTGVDPFDLQKKSQEQEQQAAQQVAQTQAATQGAGARGAVGGAAAGALIGEIADDDAGKGAAYGAAIGMVAARRRARHANEATQQQAVAQTEQTQQATAEQVTNFKKAFSVCLEAKNYMVKY